MSFSERDEKVELFDAKSSDSEDNYETDEEVNLEEIVSKSTSRLKNISIHKNHGSLGVKKNTTKNHSCTMTVSLRYGKCNRHLKSNVKFFKSIKQKRSKKPPEKNKIYLEKSAEISKKGKRCRSGGKAKGKPPEEEGHDKRDSDDDSDNFYFARISLGYFQKFKDKSGASTSYQLEEDHKKRLSLNDEGKVQNNISEETELLELQNWGNTSLVSSYDRRTDDLERLEDIKPDTI